MKIYQAGPLFTEAEQNWHRQLKARLEASGHQVIWPFELFTQEEIESLGKDAPARIMETDLRSLETCDLVVALLDGTQVDDGTAFETGYAFAKKIPVVGIRTDFRQAGETSYSTVNAMIQTACKIICRNQDELVEYIGCLKKSV